MKPVIIAAVLAGALCAGPVLGGRVSFDEAEFAEAVRRAETDQAQPELAAYLEAGTLQFLKAMNRALSLCIASKKLQDPVPFRLVVRISHKGFAGKVLASPKAQASACVARSVQGKRVASPPPVDTVHRIFKMEVRMRASSEGG